MRWDRVALLLGRYWSWITPQYLFEEMTSAEMEEAVDFVLTWEFSNNSPSRESYRSLVKSCKDWLRERDPEEKQDLRWLRPVGKVKRG